VIKHTFEEHFVFALNALGTREWGILNCNIDFWNLKTFLSSSEGKRMVCCFSTEERSTPERFKQERIFRGD
jgi:hypothetical protein